MPFISSTDSSAFEGSFPPSGQEIALSTQLIRSEDRWLWFLNANAAPHMKARVANYGLMDQIAALHWVQQNIALFGGDPGNVTMMGHGTGAACINFLMISPTVMPGLFHKAVLLSGSALSSWALVEDPVHFAVQLASQLNCTVPDIHADHESLVDCLRDVPLSRLMAADTGAPSFLSAFGPSVDGVVIKSNFQQELLLNILPELQGYSAGSIALGTPINIKKNSEILLGGTNKYDLLFGVVTSEALSGFSNGDIEAGFEGERRDKIIRTYIRNTYVYHLSEIFFTVINEYTDWERTVLHPINTRDATIAAISDAQYVAPLVQIGDLLSRPQLLQSGGGAGNGTSGAPNPPSSPGHTKSYFYVFDYQTKDGDYPQRMGTAHGEELPYIFGAPLIDGFSHFPRNFTKSEVALSEAFILYLSNFARTGNPNEFQHRAEMTLAGSKEKNRFRSITWDEYDPVHQKYLEISMKPRMKNHYRAHQLSVWLRLIPELHRAGMEGEGGASARHNVFRAVEGAELYEGVVRSDPLTSGRRHVMTSQNGTVAEIIQQPIITSSIPSHQLTSCLNITQTSQHQQNLHPNYHELSNLDLSNFASYNTALTITITIGCSLLVLNILIFAGVYYQKDRNNSNKSSGKKDRSSRKNSMSNSNSSCYLDAATSKNLLNMDTSSIIVDIERDMMLTEDKQQHCDLMLSHPQTSNAASMKTLSHLATLPRNKHIMSDTQCVTSLNTQYNAMTSQPCCNNVATLPRNITFNPVMTYDCKMAQSTGADCNFRSSNVHESFRQSPNVLECSRSSYQGNPCDGGGAKNLIKLNSSTSSSTGSGGSNPPGGNLSEMRV
ncbi:hypothetical protein M8J75_013367 [Diaphorina citri]|nr:hypothetical protein M8J75_013367 [Diaphorina citri]